MSAKTWRDDRGAKKKKKKEKAEWEEACQNSVAASQNAAGPVILAGLFVKAGGGVQWIPTSLKELLWARPIPPDIRAQDNTGSLAGVEHTAPYFIRTDAYSRKISETPL